MKKTIFYYQSKENPIFVDGKKMFKYILFLKNLGFQEISFFVDTNFDADKHSFKEEAEFALSEGLLVSVCPFVRPYQGLKMNNFVRLLSDLEQDLSDVASRWIFNIEGVCLGLDSTSKKILIKCIEAFLDIPGIEVDFCFPAYPSKKFDALLDEITFDYRDYCRAIPMLYTDRKNAVSSLGKLKQPNALWSWIQNSHKMQNVFVPDLSREQVHIAHMLNDDMSYPFPFKMSAEENVSTFYSDLASTPETQVKELLVWRSMLFKDLHVQNLWKAYSHLLSQQQ